MTDEMKRCVEALRKCDIPQNIQPVAFYVCRDCSAYEPDMPCRINLTAADLIESLAAELEEVKQERDGLNILLGQAQSMLETRTRERDAAVEEVKELGTCAYCEHDSYCPHTIPDCMHCKDERCQCHSCGHKSKWQWRGVKTDLEVQDD